MNLTGGLIRKFKNDILSLANFTDNLINKYKRVDLLKLVKTYNQAVTGLNLTDQYKRIDPSRLKTDNLREEVSRIVKSYTPRIILGKFQSDDKSLKKVHRDIKNQEAAERRLSNIIRGHLNLKPDEDKP